MSVFDLATNSWVPGPPAPTVVMPVIVAPIAPTPALVGMLWLDSSQAPPPLFTWDGNAWIPASLGGAGGIALPVSPGPDYFLKTAKVAPFAPVWSELVEGGTF